MTHFLQLLAFMMFGVLLSMATILPPALAVASSSSTFTLPIYTFRLDLTIREDDDDNNNKNRRQLLRQNILPLVQSHHHHPRSIQEIQSVESTIQSVAETHLAAIYAETFVAPPSQVLLTVVSEDEEENDKAPESDSSSGIYIRSYFLGGVVSFPTSISKSSSSSSTTTTVSIFDQLPTRSELAQVTLEAFQIPGTNGEGEEFLTELQDANHPDLKGLLLISAEEVKTTTQEGPTSSGGEDSTSTSSSSSGNGGTDSSSTTMTTTTTTSSTPDENTEGSSSVSFMNMNIWAIAAVAALAAMLLVILFCTSILYCDWRKRRERRERKRERLAAMTAAASNIHNSNTNPSYYDGSFGDVDNNISNKKRAAGVEYLQIVVPTAGSGETEDVYISPSTQGGSGANSSSSPPLPQDNVGESFNSSTGSRRASSSSSSILGNKVKKYRRSSLPKSKNLMGKKQSKAVNDQLRLADNVEAQQQQQQNQPQPPLIVNPQSFQPRVNGNGNVDMEGNEQCYYADTTAASATAEINSDPNILITGSAGEDGYSVGEDTTVLFPTINRDRSGSKDYMSDFDGYSIDGMSAVDGGYSQFGGDSSGGGGGGGVRSSSKKSSTRDMYYAGDVPRDFDSVWGDDDASRITNDTTDGSADYPPGPPAAKNTFSLNKLIEHDYEEGSQSASAGRGTNLHEFETESETSGSRGQVAGAFTLELLGKSKTIRLHKSASGGSSVSVTPSSQDDDDDDSILGRMYHDEESSELMAVVGDDNMSAIDVEDGTGDGAYNAGAVMSSRSGDSVDSTPSWAAPIQSALLKSVNKFRSTSWSEKKYDDDAANDDSTSSKDMQEKRIKDKFVSSLKGDDSSVSSNRSRGSQRSNNSNSSRGSNTSRKEMTAVLSNEKALGLTNSMDEEIDEDPTAMIDNINSMLSECREILNTESSPQ